MRRFLTAAATVFALSHITACTDEPRENPQVVTALSPACDTSERLVRDVCTELGGDDGCVDVDDVCIALCDDLQTCTTASSHLRVTNPWAVAPNGYCVECDVP